MPTHNIIVYTDYFLHNLINKLQSENAIILYTSNHGQSLGYEGHYGHSNADRREQRHVLFMIWASNIYKSFTQIASIRLIGGELINVG